MFQMQASAPHAGDVIHGFTVALEGAKNGFESASKIIIEWTGHAVRELKNLPLVIHNNPLLEIGLIVTVNTVFFLAINEGLKRLNHTLENENKPIKPERKFAKQVFVNVILPAGAMIGFNLLLYLATPINGWLVLSITIAAIAARLLINRFSTAEHRTQANINQDLQKIALAPQAQITQLTQQLNVQVQQLNTLTAERNNLQNDVNAKDAQIHTLNNQVGTLTNQISKAQKDYEDLLEAHTENKGKFTKLSDDFSNLGNNSRNFEDESNKKISQLEKKVAELTEKINEKEKMTNSMGSSFVNVPSSTNPSQVEAEKPVVFVPETG